MKLYLPLVFAGSLLTGGCALTQTTASYDGLAGDAAGPELTLLARQAADRLAQSYAPGRTRLVLTRAPGAFGDAFETGLRAHGFAVANDGEPDAEGLVVEYTADRLERDGAASSVYARIRTSDGQLFSLVRRVQAHPTQVAQVEPRADKTDAVPGFGVNPVSDVLETALVQGAGSAEPEKAGVTPERKADVPPAESWPVRYSSTAREIARRNRVPVEDFCAWNKVTPGETLPKGAHVYLRKPSSSTVAGTPAASPVPAAQSAPVAQVALARVPALEPAPVKQALAELTPSKVGQQAEQPAPKLSEPELSQKEAPPLPEAWAVRPGGLQEQVATWCQRSSYQLAWKASHDYRLESHAAFQGTFLGAVQKLFSGLHKHGVPLRVTLYEENKVLEVVEE